MKRPFGMHWMQTATIVLSAVIAFSGWPLNAIVCLLIAIIAELAAIREALNRQAGKEA